MTPTPLADPSWKVPEFRIDADGDWFDGGEPITHPGVVANLRANLRRDADGHYVQTRVRIPVAVDDAPFVVVRMERRGDTLHAFLNDGTDEPVDPATLRVGSGDVPYCAVKRGAFAARLARPAAYQLLSLADYDATTGRGALRVGGRSYPLGRVS